MSFPVSFLTAMVRCRLVDARQGPPDARAHRGGASRDESTPTGSSRWSQPSSPTSQDPWKNPAPGSRCATTVPSRRVHCGHRWTSHGSHRISGWFSLHIDRPESIVPEPCPFEWLLMPLRGFRQGWPWRRIPLLPRRVAVSHLRPIPPHHPLPPPPHLSGPKPHESERVPRAPTGH